MPKYKTRLSAYQPLRECWPFKQLHDAKIRLCRWLLETLEPDKHVIIGQSIAQAIEKKEEEWEVALLTLQAEVDERWGGGLLHGVPSVQALAAKVRDQRRHLEVCLRRERKLISITGVDHEGQLCTEVARLAQISWERDNEKAEVREAVRLMKIARNNETFAFAMMRDLEAKYDREDGFEPKVITSGLDRANSVSEERSDNVQ